MSQTSRGTVTMLNCAYELSHMRWPKLFGCTAGVRRVEGLGMIHVRNLDWPLASMGEATRLFRFHSGGASSSQSEFPDKSACCRGCCQKLIPSRSTPCRQCLSRDSIGRHL